jgi:hypothetical protein
VGVKAMGLLLITRKKLLLQNILMKSLGIWTGNIVDDKAQENGLGYLEYTGNQHEEGSST